MKMKAIDWSMIAKKAWKTRRKNQGGNGEVVQRKAVKSEKERYNEKTEKIMDRIFGRKGIDEEWDSLNREMVRKMRRKTLMERALGVYERGNGIFVGKESGEIQSYEMEWRRENWGMKCERE